MQETEKQLQEYRKKLVTEPAKARSGSPTNQAGNVRLYTMEELTEHIHMIHRK